MSHAFIDVSPGDLTLTRVEVRIILQNVQLE